MNDRAAASGLGASIPLARKPPYRISDRAVPKSVQLAPAPSWATASSCACFGAIRALRVSMSGSKQIKPGQIGETGGSGPEEVGDLGIRQPSELPPGAGPFQHRDLETARFHLLLAVLGC